MTPPLRADLWVELVVPRREQRGRDIEPLAIKRELIHLRPAGDFDAVDLGRFAQQALPSTPARSVPDYADRDVVLAHIAVQPVD